MAVKEVLPVKPYPASENRHLHVFRKIRPTPPTFPRRAGMAKKKPLGTDRPG
jgi:16S rRNA (guanine527-N7)-methyltransferase